MHSALISCTYRFIWHIISHHVILHQKYKRRISKQRKRENERKKNTWILLKQIHLFYKILFIKGVRNYIMKMLIIIQIVQLDWVDASNLNPIKKDRYHRSVVTSCGRPGRASSNANVQPLLNSLNDHTRYPIGIIERYCSCPLQMTAKQKLINGFGWILDICRLKDDRCFEFVLPDGFKAH